MLKIAHKNLKTTFRNAVKVVLSLAVITTLCSCPPPKDVDFCQELSQYLKKDMPKVTLSSNKYAAYFDFSGVYIAYNDPDTKQTFNNLTQKVTGDAASFDIYSMANDTIKELTGANSPAALFQKLHDSNQQGQLWAPIEKTLKKIAEEGRPALLVTDFEEYTTNGVIYRQAYATPYFRTWLQRGGDIQFYITDYMEGSLPKHLYYVVFDYNHHPLGRLVADALKGAPVNYRTFVLSTNSYPMATSYPSSSQGGTYHDENGEDVVSMSVEDGKDGSFFMIDSLRAESYSFDAPWPDIVANAKDQALANGAKVPFLHLFSNLYIDLSHADSYNIKALAVRVTDVQKDFDAFTAYNIAVNNPPKKVRDSEGFYLDWEGHETGEEYYDDNGNIKAEYDYPKHRPDIAEYKDVLVFDQKLFDATHSKDPANCELAVNFDQRFDGTIVGQPEDAVNDLTRIDIVIAAADICPQQKIDQLFAWPGNDCLSSSIRNVLQEMMPVGMPIYSYFVRIR